MYQQQQQMRMSLSDADMANAILGELKRVAAEYATASLEATGEVRQMFEQLLHRTLRDQEQLFHLMGSLNMYGQPMMAHDQEIQKEIQHHSQKRQELQQALRGGAGMANAGMAGAGMANAGMSGAGMSGAGYGRTMQQGQYQSGYGVQNNASYGRGNVPVYASSSSAGGDYRGQIGSSTAGSSGSGSVSYGYAGTAGSSYNGTSGTGYTGTGYTSTAGDGAYGDVEIASETETFGASESNETASSHLTGSAHSAGHVTGAAGARHRTQTGGRST